MMTKNNHQEYTNSKDNNVKRDRTFYPAFTSDITRTLVSMSKRTGMTVSQVVDEVLYTGLIEMHELDAPGKAPGVH